MKVNVPYTFQSFWFENESEIDICFCFTFILVKTHPILEFSEFVLLTAQSKLLVKQVGQCAALYQVQDWDSCCATLG